MNVVQAQAAPAHLLRASAGSDATSVAEPALLEKESDCETHD